MSSTFSWLDHSERERRKVLDAIDRFGETDTRDEIGIASIRDAFSELFFPGTTVLMTRARYFLFVPWLYLALEKSQGKGVSNRMRRAELKLIDAIGPTDGNIGRRAKSNLKRTASSIYWLGLRDWGIRLSNSSQSGYERLVERGSSSQHPARDDDGQAVAGSSWRNWDPHIPPAPDDFPEQATLDLTSVEARYLADRVRLRCPGSLLELALAAGPQPDVDFPWAHPDLATFPADVKRALAHAHKFSETMRGAALLYNLMLAEAAKRDETQQTVRERLTEWHSGVLSLAGDLNAWDRAEFWRLLASCGVAGPSTRHFVNEWLEGEHWNDRVPPSDNHRARELIRNREAKLKGVRARLSNPRALELWNGESLGARLSYRWPTARRLLADIQNASGQPKGRSNA